MDLRVTRPVRAAAELLKRSEGFVDQLFRSARVLIRLEEEFCHSADARETFLLAVNQCFRFCPNIAISVPLGTGELVEQCNHIASAVHGVGHTVTIADIKDFPSFTAIINIGTEILLGLPCTTVNSSGWVARVASSAFEGSSLPYIPTPPNAVGAHAAACLGASQSFLHLLNEPRASASFEISLLNYDIAAPGSLDSGPLLPPEPLDIDAWLIGCGGVSNGWAYTVKRLPIQGRLVAVDRESLGIENFGSYVAADRDHLNKPKVDLIRDLLHPLIVVIPNPDEWELFKIRLEFGLSVPPLIVGGLDNVETRHSVQRLWPDTLIDMAAGGLTSQVLVNQSGTNGLCLLEALKARPEERTYLERLSQQTGLRMDRISGSPTDSITEEDVAHAPEAMREELETARKRGELICGRIMRHNLSSDANDSNFTPAVPFVTSFSGVVGAAETMKWLMDRDRLTSLHFQYSFQSSRGRALEMNCAPDCECARATPRDENDLLLSARF